MREEAERKRKAAEEEQSTPRQTSLVGSLEQSMIEKGSSRIARSPSYVRRKRGVGLKRKKG